MAAAITKSGQVNAALRHSNRTNSGEGIDLLVYLPELQYYIHIGEGGM